MNTLKQAVFRTLRSQAAAVALAVIASTPALADAPSYVRIRSFTYLGSGCPSGSVLESISPDRMAIALLFESFFAEVGPGIPSSQRRRNCQMNFDLDYPQGWSYSIGAVETSGYASLERSVIAVQQSNYYFTGNASSARLQTTFTGPFDQDYQVRDVLALQQVWSPCGAARALNLNTEVRLDNSRNRTGSGLITIDSIRVPGGLRYALVWRRC